MLLGATTWRDLLPAVILAIVGAATAAFWPWLQSYWRGRKFQAIIKRELEELGPVPRRPTPNTPWWEHLQKRFVHEEVFAREHISANRDFLLSLSPDVVYKVSQLWIAFEKRDGTQWLHFLGELGPDQRVGSEKLRTAHNSWSELLKADPSGDRAPRTRDVGPPEPSSLLEARLAAYTSLVGLTRYGSEEEPLMLPDDQRVQRAEDLMNWFYDGGGLLLSSEAFLAFRIAHARLTDARKSDQERRDAFSALRTELKIDLGVRHADVRHIQMAALPAA